MGKSKKTIYGTKKKQTKKKQTKKKVKKEKVKINKSKYNQLVNKLSKLTGISEYDINNGIFHGQKFAFNSTALKGVPDEVYYSTDDNYQYILGASKKKKKSKRKTKKKSKRKSR